MKKNRKNRIGLLLFLLLFCQMQCPQIYADDFSPGEGEHIQYGTESRCMVTLTFQDNVANCIVLISGKQLTKSISGTMRLYDGTNDKYIKSQTFSVEASSYIYRMSVPVTADHKYTLLFSGLVDTEGEPLEKISARVTKTNRSALNPETETPPSETPSSETPAAGIPITPVTPDAPTETPPGVFSPAVKNDYAASKDHSLSGIYKTNAALRLRTGAGQKKTILCIMKKGSLVHCYGYYTDLDGTDWLYVQHKQNGIVYTGFCSSRYLGKVT